DCVLHQFARDMRGKLLPVQALDGIVQVAQFDKMPQIEIAEPITIVLKLIMDDQHERSVGGRRDVYAPPPQQRADAVVQSMSGATIISSSHISRTPRRSSGAVASVAAPLSNTGVTPWPFIATTASSN